MEVDKFLSMDEYLVTAERLWGKYGKVFNPSDDQIGYVVSYLMRADNKYLPSFGTAPSSWRLTYGKNGINNWFNKVGNKTRELSLDYETTKGGYGSSLLDSFASNELTPPQKLEMAEFMEHVGEVEDDKRSLYCVTEHYVNGETYKTIGKNIGVCRERVRQIVNKSKKKIRRGLEAGYGY